jgi:RNA polymerase sigma factor (sigma-70 family)
MLSHKRRQTMDRQRLDELAAVTSELDEISPADGADANRLAMQLEAAIAALSPLYREVIVLTAVEGLTPHEAAGVLQIQPEAVRQRLSRARAMIDSFLSQGEASRSQMAVPPQGVRK